ncbi:MAG TPA: hypothetical protein VH164_01590, partial [Ktedonobacteraceae bacterium]|nr:hypothetical protein [Ktedonobacteraceae bacterium]
TCDALAWSPDGKSLALVGPYLDPTVTASTPSYLYKEPQIMIVDASTGRTIVTHYSASIYPSNYSVLAWSPNGRYVASYTGSVDVWDALSAQQVSSYNNNGSDPYNNNGSVFIAPALAWSPDGRRIASSLGPEVRISYALSGKQVLTYKGHTQTVRAIAWSPDGRHMATGGDDDTVQIWNVTNGLLLSTYRQHTDSILALAWSPNGGFIASGAGSADGTVRIWIAK